MIPVKGVQTMSMIRQRSPGDQQVLLLRVVAAPQRVPETLLELLVLGGGLGARRRHVGRHLGAKTRQERGMEGTRRATLAGAAPVLWTGSIGAAF